MYVANNGYSTASNPAVGTITKVVKTPENELYFLFKGADTMLRSDFIPLDNIKSAVAIDAAAVDNTTRTNLYLYVQRGGISADFAAKEAGLTVDQFQTQMNEYINSHKDTQLV